jgi:tRNA 2-thiouridine synthesizing protein B
MAGILTRRLAKNRFCALSDDLKIRGIAADELVKGIDIIDYAELVRLTVHHRLIQSWS